MNAKRTVAPGIHVHMFGMADVAVLEGARSTLVTTAKHFSFSFAFHFVRCAGCRESCFVSISDLISPRCIVTHYMKRGRPWQLASFAHMNSTGDKLFTLVSGLFTRAVFLFFSAVFGPFLRAPSSTAQHRFRRIPFTIYFWVHNLKIERSTVASWTENDEFRTPNVPYCVLDPNSFRD